MATQTNARPSFWRRMLMNGSPTPRPAVDGRPVVGVSETVKPSGPSIELMVLGFGDVARKDEGVGINVIRHLRRRGVPRGVVCVDGGSGDPQLVDPMHNARRLVIVDGSMDGREPGTVQVLKPHCPAEFPATLTTYDTGLSRLLERFYADGEYIDVTLFAVAIDPRQTKGLGLTAPVWDSVPRVADLVLEEALRDESAA